MTEPDGLLLDQLCERYGVRDILGTIAEYCESNGAEHARAGRTEASRWDAAAIAIQNTAETIDLPEPEDA
jgi:hypothetical protein